MKFSSFKPWFIVHFSFYLEYQLELSILILKNQRIDLLKTYVISSNIKYSTNESKFDWTVWLRYSTLIRNGIIYIVQYYTNYQDFNCLWFDLFKVFRTMPHLLLRYCINSCIYKNSTPPWLSKSFKKRSNTPTPPPSHDYFIPLSIRHLRVHIYMYAC